MKQRFYVILLVSLSIMLVLQACSGDNGDTQASRPASTKENATVKTEAGKPATRQQTPSTTMENRSYPTAPNFALEDASGTTIRLSDYKGKVVILDFWATWCGPCRMEIPGYVQLYDKYKSQGLEIIGVSLDRDGWQPVRPFMDQYNINYPIVLGNQQIVQAYGGINSIPTTFIINRNGEVVERKIGARPVEYFEQILSNLL